MMVDNVCLWIALPVLSLALLLAFARLAIGPTLPDRVVAFELVAAELVGILIVSAIASDLPVLLDVAAVWAIIAFFSVIAIAYYLERWGRP